MLQEATDDRHPPMVECTNISSKYAKDVSTVQNSTSIFYLFFFVE